MYFLQCKLLSYVKLDIRPSPIFFLFSVECFFRYWVRWLDWKKTEQKNNKKSLNGRPGSPALFLRSLETTRQEPKLNLVEG